MEKKPNVVPSKGHKSDAQKIAEYEAEKRIVTHGIYTEPFRDSETPENHLSALEQMRARTASQLAQNQNGGVVQYPEFAEKPTGYISRNDEQIKQRDAQLAKNLEMIDKFQAQTQEANNRHLVEDNYKTPAMYQQPQKQEPVERYGDYGKFNNYEPPTPPSTPSNIWAGYGDYSRSEHIQQISQPDYNSPFDVIPLPSKGKTYRGKKPNIKLSYMTTADENILSSPNLLQSGEFLEVLLNRKILDNIRYKDLLPGDRNAIMIWLRATSYGEMYPVVLDDEDGMPFETVVDLNELKTIELNVEPDEDGLFTFVLPLSGKVIRFKLLTCGEMDYLEKLIETEKTNNQLVNNYATYKLERMIVEVDGSTDRQFVKEIANSMRIPDAKKLNEFINTIDCGIDLNIEIGTPGGGSLTTFLPLNLNFFWPNL
jgi:hypothetical protein